MERIASRCTSLATSAILYLLLATSVAHATGWCVYENAVVSSGAIHAGTPGNVTDAAACLILCTSNPSCNAISYDVLQARCTLHNVPDNTKPVPGNIRQPSLFVINDRRDGPSQPCFYDLVDACIVPSMYYPSDKWNLPAGAHQEASSMEDCLALCEAEFQCTSFSFDAHSQQCRLMTAGAYDKPTRATSTRVLGFIGVGCADYNYAIETSFLPGKAGKRL